MNGVEKPRGHGCLFYGAIIAAVMFAMILVGGYVGFRYAKKQVLALVNEYTETNSIPIATVRYSPDQLAQITNRIGRFSADVRAGRPVEPLVLTEEEVNVLMTRGQDPDSRSSIYFTLEDQRIKAQLSVPAEEFGLRMLEGRYLNGSGEFAIAVHDGELRINIKELSVKGKPLPEDIMRPIRRENYAARQTNDHEFTATIAGLEEIRLEKGKMVVVPKK